MRFSTFILYTQICHHAVIPAKAEALYNSEAGQSIFALAGKQVPAFAGMTAGVETFGSEGFINTKGEPMQCYVHAQLQLTSLRNASLFRAQRSIQPIAAVGLIAFAVSILYSDRQSMIGWVILAMGALIGIALLLSLRRKTGA